MTHPILHVYADNPVLVRLLGDAMRLHHLDNMAVVDDADQADTVLEGNNTYTLRLGAVLDWLQRRAMAFNNEKHNLANVRLMNGDFSPRTRTYVRPGGESVRLTDKERDILVALYLAPNRTIAKDDLLAHVWGYVPGLETHTLETHIYRLRQKIEPDPHAPASLMTTELGYHLVCKD